MLFYTSSKRGIYTVHTVHTCHPGQNSTLYNKDRWGEKKFRLRTKSILKKYLHLGWEAVFNLAETNNTRGGGG